MSSFGNSSSSPVASDNEVPIFGYPGPVFYIIHIVAISSCAISTISSLSVIIFSFLSEMKSSNRGFYSWTKGERLVVYIAAFDLAFSVAHTVDHVYIFAAVAHPVDYLCRLFAFFVIYGFTGQWLVIFYTAISAFVQVIFERNVNMGRYDWRLLVFANLIPALFCSAGVIFKYIGPGGAWCVFERNALGAIMNNVNAALMLLVFFSCAVCYIAIWIKIKITTYKAHSDTEKHKKMNRSGRIMMVFVMVFIIQWWPWAVQAIWSYFSTPNLWIIVAAVFFCNIGGLLNAFAYTILRRKYFKAKPRKPKTDKTTSDSLPTAVTDSQSGKH